MAGGIESLEDRALPSARSIISYTRLAAPRSKTSCRAALSRNSPLPSRRSLRGIDGVMSRYVQAGEPVNLSSMYRCLAADVVSAFVLPQSLNLIQSDDLGDQFSSSLRFFFEAATVGRYLELVEVVIQFVPSAVIRGMLSQPAKQLLGLVRVGHSSR